MIGSAARRQAARWLLSTSVARLVASWLTSEQLHFRVTLLFKRLLCYSFGYPHFTEQFVRDHIRKPDTDPLELAEFAATHSPKRLPVRLTFIAMVLFYWIRIILLPKNFLQVIDMNNLDNNIHWLTAAPAPLGSYQFKCIVSNCTKFPANFMANHDDEVHDTDYELQTHRPSIGAVMFELPLFRLCHEHLSNIHEPTQYLGVPGMFIASVMGFSISMAGVVLPLMTWFKPTGNLMIMFFIAPRVTRRLVEDRIRELFTELARSLHNFRVSQAVRHRQEQQREMRKALSAIQFLKVSDSPRGVGYNDRDRDYDLNHDSADYDDNHQLDFHMSRTHSLALSLANFHANHERRHFKAGALSDARTQYNCSLALSPDQYTRESSFRRPKFGSKEMSGFVRSGARPTWHERGADMETTDELVRDCLPLMRSDWWLSLGTRNMFVVQCFVYIWSITLVLSLISLGVWASSYRQTRVDRLAEVVRRMNCSLWRDTVRDPLGYVEEGASEPAVRWAELEPLYLAELKLDIKWLPTLFNHSQAFWPGVSILLFMAIYCFTSTELFCSLYEIMFELNVIIECMRQLGPVSAGRSRATRTSRSSRKSVLATRAHSGLQMETFRQVFRRLVNVRLVLVSVHALGPAGRPTDSRLESALATESLVAQLLAAHPAAHLELAVELQHKLFVSFRVFVEYVRRQAPTMALMIVFINLSNYGLIICSIWYTRSVKDFLLLPMTIVVTFWALFNFLILLASNLHAKAKGLQPLIWSLIALNSASRDLRLRHLNALWLKQVQALDLDGGLTLGAFNVRITHMRILQMMIASGTLVVFMLRF